MAESKERSWLLEAKDGLSSEARRIVVQADTRENASKIAAQLSLHLESVTEVVCWPRVPTQPRPVPDFSRVLREPNPTKSRHIVIMPTFGLVAGVSVSIALGIVLSAMLFVLTLPGFLAMVWFWLDLRRGGG